MHRVWIGETPFSGDNCDLASTMALFMTIFFDAQLLSTASVCPCRFAPFACVTGGDKIAGVLGGADVDVSTAASGAPLTCGVELLCCDCTGLAVLELSRSWPTSAVGCRVG